ncbi:MAG: efflux RND transporter periplasmic adaptor subunit [Rhodospirillaceae bacterium]|nr:MAG: efflux RND transporter periplasmic adaptor subunit [Rhodospirillaceae bacterium]
MNQESSRPSVVSRAIQTSTSLWRAQSPLFRRRFIRVVPAVAVLALLTLAFRPPPQGQQLHGAGRFAVNGPMPIATAVAEKGDMPVAVNALGTVVPLATITVRSQIAGLLTEVPFQEGQMVQKGDLLALVDPRPYQHALEQMEGQLQRDQALLKNAELDQSRYKTLLEQDSIAKQQLDTQEALVLQYRGTVQTDQAQVDTAQLNLSYCYIKAPLTGRVGLRLVDSGNYISVGEATGIAVITQMRPITVIFTVPEDNLPQILQRLRHNADLPVTAYDRGMKTVLGTGSVSSIDNQIDTTTGTVKLKARFSNDDEMLFPNQFVNISLLVDTIRDATIVPASAIQRGAPGAFVYVVNSAKAAKDVADAKGDNDSKNAGIIGRLKNKLLSHSNGSGDSGDSGDVVSVRPVKMGASSGERVVIESGLMPGDVVVTDGGDRLKDGAAVIVSSADQGRGDFKGDAEKMKSHDTPGDHPHRFHPSKDGSDAPGGHP